MNWRLDWPTAWGPRLGKGIIRTRPEDFQVDEELGFPLAGEGEHLCVRLRNAGDNTAWLAGALASALSLKETALGYCGLKDRHALTSQWFSLQLPGQDPARALSIIRRQAELLEWQWHCRKLRRGDHGANRFRLRVRGIEAEPESVERRLQRIREAGVPNYFGRQRFGREGANLQRAMGLDPKRLRGRLGKRGLYLSAARAWLFNEILADRVCAGDWRERLPGEPETVQPTACFPGDGGSRAGSPLKGREDEIAASAPHFCRLLEATRTRADRRATVLMPGELEWQWEAPGELRLDFRLPAGGFATAVLAELFEVIEETGRESATE